MPSGKILVRNSESGDPECLSHDARNCIWNIDGNALQNIAASLNPSRSLRCGAMHKAVYGDDGYGSEDTWCSKARNLLRDPLNPLSTPGAKIPPTITTKILSDIYNYPPGSSSLPATDWQVTIEQNAKVVNNVPHADFPDGNQAVIKGKNGNWIAWWGEAINWRSESSSPYFENHPKPTEKILGLTNGPLDPKWTGTFFEAGIWIMAVFRSPLDPNKLIGLTHAEMNRPGGGEPTYKSLAHIVSYDEGKTWQDPQPIAKYGANIPGKWGGMGDPGYVYDHKAKIYYAMAYSANGPGMALMRSKDLEAAPGTWEYYNNGWRGDKALGGEYSQIKLPQSGNPNLIWSTTLNKWLVVAMPWGSKDHIIFGTSTDLISWDYKNVQLPEYSPQRGPWYPFMIGEGGSHWTGDNAKIYWCDWTNGRQMKVADIHIRRL